MGKNIGKDISEYLRCKYSQNLLDHTKNYATDAFKLIQKQQFKKQQKQLVI